MTTPRLRYALSLLLVILLSAASSSSVAEPTPWRDLYRIPIPDKFPPRPRVFCTQADLDRIRADLQRGDAYTRSVVQLLRSHADVILAAAAPKPGTKPTRDDARACAVLAEVYAITGEVAYGRAARARLLTIAGEYPKLTTTRGHGRIADLTLREAPVAIDCSMAYDLIADAPFMTAPDRERIENDLLRIMAWETGHGCPKPASSNWRTWGMAILASCGAAIGDRALFDEAINGAWDPERKVYLYGAVQQISHSIFSDGIHFERSIGYTYYLADAYRYINTAAKNCGVDIWHAEVPGIAAPFVGAADHDEYGPPGPRHLKTMFDALFYLSFADRTVAMINDSGARDLHPAPVFMHAWKEYRDPKFAWLMNQRDDDARQLSGWKVWAPAGNPTWERVSNGARSGNCAVRVRTDAKGRVGLVQDIALDLARPTIVSGWVRALAMSDGASAHFRLHPDLGRKAVYSNRVQKTGDWTHVEARVPAGAKRVRVVVFLEGGAGEVLWDDLSVSQGDSGENLLADPGFESDRVDHRPIDFWHLVHAPESIPAGAFSLVPNAKIGLTGRHKNGCTLFPVGGFAVLRAQAENPEATGLVVTYGPYGNGHDHPDRLHVSLYGLGHMLLLDAGTWGYGKPMHLNWANQTIAHNTVTINEVAQLPQGRSDSIWAMERDGMTVCGTLHLFHPGERLKAVRVSCDNVYPGALLDRTLCLVDNYVLDVVRVTSGSAITIDLPYHGRGELRPASDVTAAQPIAFKTRGYAELKNPRLVDAPDAPFVADFVEKDGASLRILHASGGRGAQLILATDPTRTQTPRACLLSRRHAVSTVFVSVLEPHRGEPTVRDLKVEPTPDGLRVTVSRREGTDRFQLPQALDGSLALERLAPSGKLLATETAAPGTKIALF